MTDDQTIEVGTTADGETFALPIEEILTGRGFVTGKSGAGKSNTASVILEKLLEAGYGFLVVDVDGEYYGLKEQYEILHAGAGETCDIQVGPEHAEKLASLALEQHVPIILDVSEYVDEAGPGEQSDEARELVRRTAESLFTMEHDLLHPFLLVVEEIHEFVPEGAGLDAVGQQLVQIGKRGRKRGLGLVGLSQRPADVKKDFITQCDWLVWHRLTWENDTAVVRKVVGKDYQEPVQTLDSGEAFVQLDWADEEVIRVQFDRKQTFDAGETPGLDDVERPELKGIDEDLAEKVHVPHVEDEDKTDETHLEEPNALSLLRHYRSDPADFGTRKHVLLELEWIIGARRGGIRGLDIRDVHTDDHFVEFHHRADTGTPLKNGKGHHPVGGERFVGIPPEVSEALDRYLDHHRHDVHDEYGRQPLITTPHGRISLGILQASSYRATIPCEFGPCPHGQDPDTCPWTWQTYSHACPSSRSPHQVRTGSIMWQRDIGIPQDVVEERVNSQALDEYYDHHTPRLRLERRRRQWVERLDVDRDSDAEDDHSDDDQK